MRVPRRRATLVLTVLVALTGLLTAIAPPASAHTYPPLITGMSTHHGPYLGGSQVDVYGFHFYRSAVVTVGGIRARRVQHLSTRRLVVTVPARPDAGDVHVYVYTGAGRSNRTGASAFRYDPAPSIRAMSRHVGREDGTPRVRIYGHDFINVQSIAVGTERSTRFTVRSSGVIDAYLPPYSAGVRHVRVITASGASNPTAAAGVFQYIPPPNITSVSRASGSNEGGTRVVIRGTDLGSLTSVQFGSAPATNVRPVSATEVHVSTPSHSDGLVHAIVTTRFGSSERRITDRFRYGRPQPVTWHAVDADSSGDLADVSCPTAEFCVAVDHHDHWMRTGDGGATWSTPVLAAGGYGVSCSSPTFCMSVILNYANAFDGSTFQRPFPTVAGAAGLHELSCPTDDFCLASGDYQATIWNGTSWSTPIHPFGEHVGAISCWASGECAALSSPYGNDVIVLRDGVWQQPVSLGLLSTPDAPEDDGVSAISCPDADHCFVGTEQGTVLTVSPSAAGADSVSSALAVLPKIDRVECADAASCVAIGPDTATDHSLVTIWDGSGWSAAVGAPSTVARASCPVAGRCVLVGGSTATTLDW